MHEENLLEVEHSFVFKLTVAKTCLLSIAYNTIDNKSESESKVSPEHATSMMCAWPLNGPDFKPEK